MTHIQNIEIKNFKSIRHARLEGCKRINVLVGPPNVGKSNVLEALGITIYGDEKEISLKSLVRFNEFSELFFDGDIENDPVVLVEDGSFDKICVKIQLHYADENALFGFAYSGEAALMPHDIRDYVINFNVDLSGSVKIKNYQDKTTHYKFVNQQFAKKYIYLIHSEFNKNGSLTGLSYPFGENLFRIIANNKEVMSIAAEIFQKYGLKLLLDKSNNDFKLVKQFGKNVIFPIPFHQIADTLQRLLFYIAAVVTNKNSVLLFEEPESHMYPVYISKFTRQMMYDENNNQFFLATHSPYVLNDLLDQVREDVAMYICSYVNGETVIQRMTDDEMLEAAQFGYDFFMNLENFVKS